MYIFKVGDREFKIRFSYRSFCDTDILDRIISGTDSIDFGDGATAGYVARQIYSYTVETAAELLLIGMQKYHGKEFGCSTEEEKKSSLDRIIDLFDQYEEEATINEDGEPSQSAFTLYADLQEEMRKNGFLRQMLDMARENPEPIPETPETAREAAETNLRIVSPTESE